MILVLANTGNDIKRIEIMHFLPITSYNSTLRLESDKYIK